MDGAVDVLVVIAHPDDELFVSGTMCLCIERGLRLGLVCVTGGEGGSPIILKPGDKTSRLAHIRQLEVTLSAANLGIDTVFFLAQPDVAFPDRPGEGAWDQDYVTGRITEIIKTNEPDLILTHGPHGGYGHPAHKLVNQCVMAAADFVDYSGSIFSFAGKVPAAFFSWHFDDESTVLADVRSFQNRRVTSLCYHQSQIDYFLQPYFPRSLRKILSAAFGYAFRMTEAGRKRVPIGTPRRFFAKFPTEGLVLRLAPQSGHHFFLNWFGDDKRIQING